MWAVRAGKLKALIQHRSTFIPSTPVKAFQLPQPFNCHQPGESAASLRMRFLSILLAFIPLVSFVLSVSTVILPASIIDGNDIGPTSANENGVNKAGPPAYRCETSDASPLSFHVLIAVTVLDGLNTARCQQTNSGGSQCKNLQTVGSASVGICAGPGEWLECGRAAEVVKNLVSFCQRFIHGKWKTGGYIVVEHPAKTESHKIIVYNSKDN